MRQHARKAYDELESKGLYLMNGQGIGSYFAIGIEPINPKSLDDFDRWIHRMINTTIPKILEKHGLCSYWENGVVIGVYDKEA